MVTTSNITKDLSTLTKIPVKVLDSLHESECVCIGSAIHDAMISKLDIATLNIGIGALCVNLITKECKFLPSAELKSTIKKSIDEKIDPLEYTLDKTIVDKILKIYEEVM